MTMSAGYGKAGEDQGKGPAVAVADVKGMIDTYEIILVFWLAIVLVQGEKEDQKSCWKFEICNLQRGRSLPGGGLDLRRTGS
jgi:hypothetical protein